MSRNSDPRDSRNLKAAKALGMQTIREGFFSATYRGYSVDDPPTFCIGVPIGGSLEAIRSLESILGIDLESSSAETIGIGAGVGSLTKL